MNKSTIFKGVALINFAILIGVFLLYKNGSFDNFIYEKQQIFSNPNGSSPLQTSNDSVSIEKDSLVLKEFDDIERIRFSSSKSMRIIEEIPVKIDSGNLNAIHNALFSDSLKQKKTEKKIKKNK